MFREEPTILLSVLDKDHASQWIKSLTHLYNFNTPTQSLLLLINDLIISILNSLKLSELTDNQLIIRK